MMMFHYKNLENYIAVSQINSIKINTLYRNENISFSMFAG